MVAGGVNATAKNDPRSPLLADGGELLEPVSVGASRRTTTDAAPQVREREPDDNSIDDPPIAVDDPVTTRTGSPDVVTGRTRCWPLIRTKRPRLRSSRPGSRCTRRDVRRRPCRCSGVVVVVSERPARPRSSSDLAPRPSDWSSPTSTEHSLIVSLSPSLTTTRHEPRTQGLLPACCRAVTALAVGSPDA